MSAVSWQSVRKTFLLLGVLVAAAGAVAAYQLWHAREQLLPLIPDPRWSSYDTQGHDQQGKALEARVLVLSQEHRWRFGRADEVELGGRGADLREHLRSLEIPTDLGIVGVGTASVEGDRSEEESRAQDRAETLIATLREEFPRTAGLYGLNLGQFTKPFRPRTTAQTATQRRVIVIAILQQDKGIDLRAALFDALVRLASSDTPVPFDIRDYSQFRLFTATGAPRVARK
jgi:hypothetical protein